MSHSLQILARKLFDAADRLVDGTPDEKGQVKSAVSAAFGQLSVVRTFGTDGIVD